MGNRVPDDVNPVDDGRGPFDHIPSKIDQLLSVGSGPAGHRLSHLRVDVAVVEVQRADILRGGTPLRFVEHTAAVPTASDTEKSTTGFAAEWIVLFELLPGKFPVP